MVRDCQVCYEPWSSGVTKHRAQRTEIWQNMASWGGAVDGIYSKTARTDETPHRTKLRTDLLPCGCDITTIPDRRRTENYSTTTICLYSSDYNVYKFRYVQYKNYQTSLSLGVAYCEVSRNEFPQLRAAEQPSRSIVNQRRGTGTISRLASWSFGLIMSSKLRPTHYKERSRTRLLAVRCARPLATDVWQLISASNSGSIFTIAILDTCYPLLLDTTKLTYFSAERCTRCGVSSHLLVLTKHHTARSLHWNEGITRNICHPDTSSPRSPHRISVRLMCYMCISITGYISTASDKITKGCHHWEVDHSCVNQSYIVE